MSYQPIEVKSIKPLYDHVLVTEMSFAERVSSSGIILRSDDAKLEGIRPRWGCIYAVGPEQEELKVGQWVCVAHGRWTRGVKIKDAFGQEFTVRRVDVDDIMLVSDEKPTDDTIADGL